MLIKQEDGTYFAGPLDVVCILHNVKTGIFHPAFFEESPLPGPVPTVEDTTVVRLKSKMHHTEGYRTIEEAKVGLATELRSKIKVPDSNVSEDPVPWDGELGIVWIYPNWLRLGGTFGSILNAGTE